MLLLPHELLSVAELPSQLLLLLLGSPEDVEEEEDNWRDWSSSILASSGA